MRDTCANQAAESIEDTLNSQDIEPKLVIPAIERLIGVAVAREDTPAIRTWCERLETVSGDSDVAIKAYFEGSRMDHTFCSERLSELLDHEQEAAELLLPHHRLVTPGTYRQLAPGIHAIVETCAKQTLPPDSWVARAINSEHVWSLWLTYYAATPKGQESGQDTGIKQRIIDPLLDENNGMSNDFLAFAISRTLETVSGSQTYIKRDLLEKYLAASDERTVRVETLLNLTELGSSVFLDNDLRTPAIEAEFDGLISFFLRSLVKNGASRYDISLSILPWDVAHEFQANAKAVIRMCDEWVYMAANIDTTNSLFISGPADDPHRMSLLTREALLSKYAVIYASGGDFQSSAMIVNALATEGARMKTLKECLAYADSPAKMGRYLPQPEIAVFHRDNVPPVREALLRLEGNVEHIGAYAHDLLYRILGQPMKQALLESTLQDLVTTTYTINLPAGNALVRALTDRLRAAPEPNIDLLLKIGSIRLKQDFDSALCQRYLDDLNQIESPLYRANTLSWLAQIV